MLDEAFELMQRGGSLMWAILLVSVLTVTFVLERAYVLWVRYRLDINQFFEHLVELVEDQKYSRALEVCNAQERHPFARIAKAGLMKAGSPDRDIQRAMEAAAVREYPVITQRVAYLATFANVATLLGLLGTVMGLIDAFHGISEADAAAKQEILSKGIAVAMLTTAFGLVTAIPALLSYAVLQARQNTLLAHTEAKATELLSYLAEKSRAGTRRPG
jgi:biopolymer transport protein ExbB/TolQ